MTMNIEELLANGASEINPGSSSQEAIRAPQSDSKGAGLPWPWDDKINPSEPVLNVVEAAVKAMSNPQYDPHDPNTPLPGLLAELVPEAPKLEILERKPVVQLPPPLEKLERKKPVKPPEPEKPQPKFVEFKSDKTVLVELGNEVTNIYTFMYYLGEDTTPSHILWTLSEKQVIEVNKDIEKVAYDVGTENYNLQIVKFCRMIIFRLISNGNSGFCPTTSINDLRDRMNNRKLWREDRSCLSPADSRAGVLVKMLMITTDAKRADANPQRGLDGKYLVPQTVDSGRLSEDAFIAGKFVVIRSTLNSISHPQSLMTF